MLTVEKGDRIAAEWFMHTKLVALSGAQLKASTTKVVVAGVVRHIRGDHPTEPTKTRLYIDPEHEWDGPTVRPYGCRCEKEHVEVDPNHVLAASTGTEPAG
jgi:hypothetical protein